MGIVSGGYNLYGYKLGVIMLETKFPRIIGDIGNALTWDFPVLYKIVKGGTPNKVVLKLTKDDILPFINAAVELESQGVKAITTSCGFLSLFQKEIREQVNIPVFTSALMMVPWIHEMISSKGKIGILTANSDTLSEKHLDAVNISGVPHVIYGLQRKDVFTNFTVQNRETVDTDICERELVDTAKQMVKENPDVKVIVAECTNMPPYTDAIKRAVGLPVFDLVNLVNFVVKAL